MRLTLALLAVALCTPPLTLLGQATPPARAHHSLVYSPAHGGVLLTAGSTPHDGGQRFEFFNDLWILDAAGWRRLGTVGSMMSGVALAFDSQRGRLFSLGGYDGQALGDLRVLEANQWRVLGPFPGGALAEPGLVYDAARDRLVAFGGSAAAGGAAGETWEYDGNSWSKREIAGPPGRQAHLLVYDPRRRRVVLFGGMGAGAPGRPGPRLADTWEYDGTRWEQRATEGPGARLGAGATFDSTRGVVLLFGGAGPAGFLGDTWSWDGTTWRQLATTGPTPRVMGYLAYDPTRDRTILFGGRKGWPDGDLNDTWEWDGAAWRAWHAAGGVGP